MPDHHVSEDLLIDHVAGNLPEAMSLLIASHLCLCPDCRVDVDRLALVAGVILERSPCAPIDSDMLETVLTQIDAGAPAPAAKPAPADGTTNVPGPLAAHIGDDFEALSWRRLLPGSYACDLAVGTSRIGTSLIRLNGGSEVPEHGHGGLELTLVLSGRLQDGATLLCAGDVSVCDAGVTHQPTAAAGEDCVCLWVSEVPPLFTGPLGHTINPFLRP